MEKCEHAARIVRFSPTGRHNSFADPGLASVKTPYGNVYFRGGHKLWHSPEAMPLIYIPNNEGATISEISNGVRIEMPAEPWTNISKTTEVQLNLERQQVILHHELRNDGAWAVEFAPWALTMFRLGGAGIFPQPQGNIDEEGLLPNRRMSFWPCTRIDDPRLTLRDDFILVRATLSLPPLKFGYFNPDGWMAYWLDGVLFVKRFDVQRNTQHPDNGCSSESFCNDQFIELETLGALQSIPPGGVIAHTESWELYESFEVPFIPVVIQE